MAEDESMLEAHLRKKLDVARQVFYTRSVRAGLLENRIAELWSVLRCEEQEFLDSVESAKMALKDLQKAVNDLNNVTKVKND